MTGSREASMATHWIPSWLMASTRFGLSSGCCGRIRSPEYSPGANSVVDIGMPFCWAQVTLFSISPWIVGRSTYSVLPLESSVHCQGLTVKSWMQPSQACVYVWLIHQNWLATGWNAVSSGSVPVTWNRDDAPPLNRNSIVKLCCFSQFTAEGTSGGVIRLR